MGKPCGNFVLSGKAKHVFAILSLKLKLDECNGNNLDLEKSIELRKEANEILKDCGRDLREVIRETEIELMRLKTKDCFVSPGTKCSKEKCIESCPVWQEKLEKK
jgi:hypothetical protein